MLGWVVVVITGSGVDEIAGRRFSVSVYDISVGAAEGSSLVVDWRLVEITVKGISVTGGLWGREFQLSLPEIVGLHTDFLVVVAVVFGIDVVVVSSVIGSTDATSDTVLDL